MKKILFLDRDGVLNVDTGYLHKIEDLQWIPGVKEGLLKAVHDGYEIIVVTNQSGVARGYYTEEDVAILHTHMVKILGSWGIPILRFYYCPHYVGAPIEKYNVECNCRKPKPGMILQAFEEYEIDKERSFLIGDSVRDVEAAVAAGLRGYLFTDDSFDLCIDKVLKIENQ